VAAGPEHPISRADQGNSGRKSDAAGRARDQGDLVARCAQLCLCHLEFLFNAY
jgi:hypothetical protein